MWEKIAAQPGSTGTTAGTTIRTEGGYVAMGFQFVVEAVGATPTLTYRWEGSLDGTNWKPVAYITDAADTVAATDRVVTAVGVELLFLANPVARRYRYFRLVVTANTNVTYSAKLFADENV